MILSALQSVLGCRPVFLGEWASQAQFESQRATGPVLSHAGTGMGYVAFLRIQPQMKRVTVVMGNGTYLDGSLGERIADGAGQFVAD